MRRLLLRPPPKPSASAVQLSAAANIRRLRRRNSRYVSREGDVILNWGNSQRAEPNTRRAVYLNPPESVRLAVDKLTTYKILEASGIPTCKITQDYDEALNWIEDGHRVLRRSTATAAGGVGVTVHSLDGSKWTEAGLPEVDTYDGYYVQVFGQRPKDVHEYRLHVIGGEVIDFQRKMRRRDNVKQTNPYVRTAKNGWVFCRDTPPPPKVLIESARRAVRCLRLDFAAVDAGNADGGAGAYPSIIIYELNTAPGLVGGTLGTYSRYLTALARSR